MGEDGRVNISTRSTLIPQLSVASSSRVCIEQARASRSDRISDRLLVPSMFLSVVCASSLKYPVKQDLKTAPRRMVGILHVGHADRCIADTVIDDGVDRGRDGVLGEDLLRGDVE